jgi:hypothetical protein
MSGILIPLLLAVWVGAITVFIGLDLADEFLWIPVLLAFGGVLSSILPLVIAPNIALATNAATLILFTVAVQWLRPKRRRTIAPGGRQ